MFNQGDDEGVTSDVMFIDFLMKNINTCVVFFFFFWKVLTSIVTRHFSSLFQNGMSASTSFLNS